jgi:hypothetical protein
VIGPAPAGGLTYNPAAGTVLGPGTQTLSVTAAATTDYNTATASVSLSVLSQFLELLDPSTKGALTVSGNGSVNIPGPVAVDSTSAMAILVSGNAQLSGTSILIAGGYQKSSNATISPTPATGSPPFADPLASLSGPSTTGLTNYGTVSVSGNNTRTLQPGIYSAIKVSGNASVTLSAGLYLIEGGGFTVTGNANVTGTGVTIYNANSNYPNPGGNTGGITLSGNGTFNLSAATSPVNGAYPGIVIFQSRANTRALAISGNAASRLTGTVYAANAPVVASGNASFQVAMIADALSVSGNVHLTQMAAGSNGAGESDGIANTLLAGDLEVYVNDPAGYFTANELARIQDAITGLDALLVPFNVQITEVSDPTLANLVVDTGFTSAAGSAADSVLGCFKADVGEITLLQGWNWYDGADPTQIGAGQYDFQTTLTHELGHALGLGHSLNPASPMYATLAPGTSNRTLTGADLNISDPPAGAEPLRAAPRPIAVAPASVPSALPSSPAAGSASTPLALGSLYPAPVDAIMAFLNRGSPAVLSGGGTGATAMGPTGATGNGAAGAGSSLLGLALGSAGDAGTASPIAPDEGWAMPEDQPAGDTSGAPETLSPEVVGRLLDAVGETVPAARAVGPLALREVPFDGAGVVAWPPPIGPAAEPSIAWAGLLALLLPAAGPFPQDRRRPLGAVR